MSSDEEEDRQYFTLADANHQLHHLRELFERVMQLRAQLKTLYQRLENAGHPPERFDGPIGVFWGDQGEHSAPRTAHSDPPNGDG